jgi:hypothetical protein
MTPQSPKRFRVCISTWECFERIIEAEDEAEANDLALEILDSEGLDGFRLCNSGQDDIFTTEPIQDEKARRK